MAWISALASCFLLGIGLGGAFDLWLLRPTLAAAALGLALLAIPSRSRPRITRAVTLLAVLSAGLALPAHEVPKASIAAGLYRLELTVERTEHDARGGRVDARVHRGERIEDHASIAPGARIRVRGDLPPGARVLVLSRLRPTARFRNRSTHVPWPRQSLDATGRLIGPPDVITRSWWREAVDEIRTHIRARLSETLAPGSAGVARALVLGDRGAVDEFRRDAVRGAGLAHVLAVSGLHVAVSVGLFVWLLRFVLARIAPLAARMDATRLAYALGAPSALAYAELAGGAPSARRAALTAALAFALSAAGRRPAAIPLALTAIAVLAASAPDRILDPGLVLSVLATLAVITARRPADDSASARIRAAARVSLRATIATAPVVWWCFGSVPLVGVVANVILAPLAAALLLPAALLHALIATVAPMLSAATAWIFEHIDSAFTMACALLSEASLGRDLPPPTPAQGAVVAVGALVVLLIRCPRRAVAVGALTLALAFALEAGVRFEERGRDRVRVTFVDVGQGDASIIDLPTGETMVIDGGGGAARPGLRALVPLLRARRRTRIDVVVLTHPHPDHYEGLSDLLDALPVGELWDSGQATSEDPDGPVARLLERARGLGTRILGPQQLCARPRRYGRASVEIHAPCPGYDPGYDPNDNSLVLSLRYGSRAFLFTGDAEAYEESRLVQMGAALDADVLKVPHHGSRTSSGAALISAVGPRLSIISAGANNRYGHPHPEVFARLARAGRVLTTSRDGGVEVITDGRKLEVRPYHGPAFSP